MSIVKTQIVAALCPILPREIIEHLINEYQEIKHQFTLGKYRPSELNGGRFAECIFRLIQHLHSPPYTPFGEQLKDIDRLIRQVESNNTLHHSIRIHIPRLSRILLDIRNRRDIAHVGGEVNPNYSDSLFISHSADWLFTEIIRIYYSCSIDKAKEIVASLNQTSIPIIADIDGFIRVQNTKLDFRQKTLAILYYKHPEKVRDTLLIKWTKYSNATKFKKDILSKLDAECLIHYYQGECQLLAKGIKYVEKYIPMNILLDD